MMSNISQEIFDTWCMYDCMSNSWQFLVRFSDCLFQSNGTREIIAYRLKITKNTIWIPIAMFGEYIEDGVNTSIHGSVYFV